MLQLLTVLDENVSTGAGLCGLAPLSSCHLCRILREITLTSFEFEYAQFGKIPFLFVEFGKGIWRYRQRGKNARIHRHSILAFTRTAFCPVHRALESPSHGFLLSRAVCEANHLSFAPFLHWSLTALIWSNSCGKPSVHYVVCLITKLSLRSANLISILQVRK